MRRDVAQDVQRLPEDVHVTTPKLLALAKFWCELSEYGRLPARSEFTPQNLRAWLGHIALVNVSEAPRRFRVRLMGEKLVSYAERDFTGLWLDECLPVEAQDGVLRPLRACCDAREPVYDNLAYIIPGLNRCYLHRLYLPCAEDGENIDTVMVGAYEMDAPPH